MAQFRYQGMTPTGESMSGTLEADSPDRAQALLAAMQVKVYSLEPAPKEPPPTRLGRAEFLLFNEQLAAITKAGLPLEKALRQVAGEVQSGRLRRAILELAAELEAGRPLEEAFARHQRSFPYLYGRIIQAGVRTGRLSDMLASLSRHLEMAGQTRRIVQDALTYPALILTLASIIVTGLLLYVVPTFRSAFEETVGVLGARQLAVPWNVAALFWMSDHVARLWILLGCLVGGLVALRLLLATSDAGRRWWERGVMAVPALGRLYHRTHLARLCDAMAILVGSGCDLPGALRLAGGASGSPNLVADCENLALAVEAGHFPDPREAGAPHVPALMIYSMRLGSQRNDLEASLYSLSDMYTRQARHLQANLQAVLLPVMIVLLGAVIAFVITALLAPLGVALSVFRPF